MDKQVLSIKELTRYIKSKLESDALLRDVWVQGEISNFTHHSSGHMYFTLKDRDSRVKCIMFASHNQRLPFMPKEGAKVLARGNVSVYERDGNYQFYVTDMQPDGIGSLYLAFEELKRKLEQEGLFAPERKRPIPRFPRAIGVVTSPTGAAVRDIITTLTRRYPVVPVLLYPVSVQGKLAAPSIVRAIEQMNALNEVDVLIVGRGGGSLEELWAFNEEIVARSIAQSAIPVISAVGHETDFTIADFVADLRAATPTAAAELAVPHLMELRQELSNAERRMHKALQNGLRRSRERLHALKRSAVLTQPHRLLTDPAQRLDRLDEQLKHRASQAVNRAKESRLRLEGRLLRRSPKQNADRARDQTRHLKARMLHAMRQLARTSRMEFQASVRQLDALSPLKVMDRGYSLTYNEQESRLIKSIGQVQMGDLLKIRLKDGKLSCQVWSMEEERKP